MISITKLIRLCRLFIQKWYERIKQTLLKITLTAVAFIALLWMSVFLYTMFYYTYMPKVSHMKTVYLQFSSACDTTPSNGLCSFPSANITLMKPDKTELFMPGQPYKIFLQLVLPQSPANQQLGMFMVLLQLKSRENLVIQQSSRSVMLHYKSQILQFLETLIFLPLLVSDVKEEKQMLTVNFFDFYLDDPFQPAVYGYVEVQSRFIQLYEATLNIHAHFTGLRYILFHWPLLSAIFGVTSNMLFLAFIAALSWYRVVYSRESHQVIVKVGFDSGDKSPSLTQRRNQMRERMKSLSGSITVPANLDHVVDDTPAISTSASAAPTPVNVHRRRQSVPSVRFSLHNDDDDDTSTSVVGPAGTTTIHAAS